MIRGRLIFAVPVSLQASFLGACLLLPAASLLAQAPAAAPEGSAASQAKRWTFDVVSIRPSASTDTRIIGAGQDAYQAVGFPLDLSISFAYFPMTWVYLRQSLIVGAPDWVSKTPFDFNAKVAAADVAEWRRYKDDPASVPGNPMLQAMLQKALAERCGLQVHREPGTVRGYALVLDKKGLNRNEVKPSAGGDPRLPDEFPLGGGGYIIPTVPGAPDLTFGFVHVPMAALANQISDFIRTPIVDRTGLAGTYDFTLYKLPAEQTDVVPAGDQWDFEKLGLRLEPTDVPVEKVVITHIDKPDAN